ncbi:MAG: MarR family winged helix-turn-helix transcriptional regulator [Agromyces sp.]
MSSAAITAWEALFRAQVRALRVLHAEFPEDSVSFNEYDVLFTISREPGNAIRLRDLTRNVLLSQSSVSRLVDRLVQRGLVSKHDDPLDGRGAIVSFTNKGAQLFRGVARTHGASIERLMSVALPESDLAELTRICQQLQRMLPDVAPNTHRSGNPPQ